MKWFHHDCAASHDPKLQILGATHGAEGLGVFWGLLEQIGQHSDTFHLKIMEISEKADKSFANLILQPEKDSEQMFESHVDLARIPRLPIKNLAKNVFTSSKRLPKVITSCIDIGLFDRQKWLKYNVLHSASFERRGDDYTRRMQRNHVLSSGEGAENVRTHSEQASNIIRRRSEPGSNTVRTLFGQTPELLRTKSENVLLETEAEQIQKEKKNRYRTEKDLFVKDTNDKSGANADIPKGHRLSSSDYYELLRGEPYLISLSEEEFMAYSLKFRQEISQWNEGRPDKFNWVPKESQLRKFFFGGSEDDKLTLCYHAYRVLDEKVHYPELVLRALRLMLKASGTVRISNPYGWMLSCLQGNSDGTLPWVQLMTAEEEINMASSSRRRPHNDFPP